MAKFNFTTKIWNGACEYGIDRGRSPDYKTTTTGAWKPLTEAPGRFKLAVLFQIFALFFDGIDMERSPDENATRIGYHAFLKSFVWLIRNGA